MKILKLYLLVSDSVALAGQWDPELLEHRH